MIVASLLLNVLVLVPVTFSLIVNAAWTPQAFGERTPARDILLAIYLAILVGSSALLVAFIAAPGAAWVATAVVALLAVQVIYKALTAITVRRSLRNPVVLSNLGIAAVHVVTVLVTVVL